MAIPRSVPVITSAGLQVASPSAVHGSHVFRSASNFNGITDEIVNLVIDHAGNLGNIKYIKEWWEDPAIVGEAEEFPCFYLLPLYLDEKKTKLDKTYESSRYIDDPLALTTFPLTVMAYYKYTNIRQPVRDVRDYAWNFFDILLEDMRTYVRLSGMKSSTPHIGWHMAGTNYIIQWWAIQLEMTAIL